MTKRDTLGYIAADALHAIYVARRYAESMNNPYREELLDILTLGEING